MNKIKHLVLLTSFLLCCGANIVLAQDSDGTLPSAAPEPATVALMTAGLAGIGIVAWRRNRRK
jgi:hypothetical protein